MKWLTRPSVIMAAASAALLVGAAALVLRSAPALPRPVPSPVAEGDREIVWLNTTTNASSWERFVAAVGTAEARLQSDHPGLRAEVGEAAFPKETTAVPEAALVLPGGQGRLVFRWYKITSDWKTHDWVEALLKRRPPPLAVIGGASSDAAREVARQLRDQAAALPDQDRPLLLLTTATADRVADPDDPAGARQVELTRLYPDRTFRFCFSNRQMASAVMRFLAGQDDLRPGPTSVHMVQWDDDSYSRDLTDGFLDALPDRSAPTNPGRVASSVGSFLTPNRYEADVVGQVLTDLEGDPGRPLLIVTGQSAPCRRFLRALACTSPSQARRLVVATGDAVAFNTVYRDRRVAWPIQDLPFPLVFFCHFNPIDRDAKFLPEGEAPRDPSADHASSATGTEDVLLNSYIVESLTQAFARDGRPAADAGELTTRLAEIRHRRGLVGYDPEGTPLFGPDGNRLGGAGENIVCLRPRLEGDRVLPEATIEVWFSRENNPHAARPWTLRDEDQPDKGKLIASYEPPVVEERSGP